MLFKTSKEINAYAQIVLDTNFASLRPTLKNVEQQHIVPVIGRELYNSLNSAYSLITDENSLSPALKLLLERCRSIIGPYLCYYFAPKSDVKLGDNGMQRHETGAAKTAFKEQRKEFREANLREAEAETETLLEFLEENKESYPEWLTGKAFARHRKLFIKSGNDFQELFNSHSPYRNYWAMRTKMEDVEENNIRPAIHNTLFDYLKQIDQSATGSFSYKEEQLLYKLKKAIAYFTVSFSVPQISVRIDSNGFTVSTNLEVDSDQESKRTAAPDPAISQLVKSSYENGQTWLSNALEYLQINKTDFPSWIIPEAAPADPSINRYLGGSFGMY